MSMPAFYLPPEAWTGAPALTGDEARHANVLRMQAGEEILVLDGLGRAAVCQITAVGRKRIDLAFDRQWQTEPPAARCVVALALSKAVRRGFFLEKAAELGAWEIWFWNATRSQGRLDAKLIESCAAQLRAGAKQCHNPWFPRTRSFRDAAHLVLGAQEAQWRILPWEERAGDKVIAQADLARPGLTLFAIGPEGGLTEEEVELFKNGGFALASLGPRVLRCETAATLCLALHWWAAQIDAEKDCP